MAPLMTDSSYFLDTCVPMYATGRESKYRDACYQILHAIARKEVSAVTDTEVIQEIIYRHHAIARPADGTKLASDLLILMGDGMLPVTRDDAERFVTLSRSYPFIRPRDLVHVAVMVGAGIDQILTADKHFDAVREVRRIDPLDFRW